MYINHLELHNFRCFDKLELDFHNQLTVAENTLLWN